MSFRFHCKLPTKGPINKKTYPFVNSIPSLRALAEHRDGFRKFVLPWFGATLHGNRIELGARGSEFEQLGFNTHVLRGVGMCQHTGALKTYTSPSEPTHTPTNHKKARREASKQAINQASEQASKQANTQANKQHTHKQKPRQQTNQTSRQLSKDATTQATWQPSKQTTNQQTSK